MSVLNTKAGVISRDAGYLQFATTEGNIDVMNNQPYGTNTITQKFKGVQYSNVQSAIDDIRNFSILPLETVLINADGISPEGQAQSDEWTFTGTVENGDAASGTPIIISVYGFPVTGAVGDTAEEFTAKVKTVLEDASVRNEIINEVTDSATGGNILNIKYQDNQVHNLPTYSDHGITVTPVVTSPAKAGYGTWNLIGRQSITFDGASEPTVLHYFKRIG